MTIINILIIVNILFLIESIYSYANINTFINTVNNTIKNEETKSTIKSFTNQQNKKFWPTYIISFILLIISICINSDFIVLLIPISLGFVSYSSYASLTAIRKFNRFVNPEYFKKKYDNKKV